MLPVHCGTGHDKPKANIASSAALNPQTAQAKQRTQTPESEGTGEKCLGSARSTDGTAAAGSAQCFLLTQVRDDSVILPVLSSLSLKTSSVVRLNYFGSPNSLINKLFGCDIPQKLQAHRMHSRDKRRAQRCRPRALSSHCRARAVSADTLPHAFEEFLLAWLGKNNNDIAWDFLNPSLQ